MIDVHAPEHRISGTRDFFMHLFTITVGLLIALGLENAAEAWHHRHQRNEAEATIRQEIRENRDDLAKSQATTDAELNNLVAALGFLEARSEGKAASTDGITLSFSLIHLDDTGWRTAATTGVIQYMDYAEVKRLAGSYDAQAIFNGLQNQTVDNYLKLNSYIAANKNPQNLSPQEVAEAMSDVRNTIAHLVAMRDVSRDLLKSYDESLK